MLLIVGPQLFGFPSPVSYVETDSMEPQLEPGDGFIGIPKPLAGDITSGDVITFRAQSVGGGGLTTHRVVAETEEGYITKGDNNPFTDQEADAGEPPVTEAQIELVVLQLSDTIIKIPNIGAVVEITTGILSTAIGILGLSNITATNPGIIVATVGLVLIILAVLYDIATDNKIRSTTRSVRRNNAIDSRIILLLILIIASLPILSISLLPSGTDQMQILSTERPQPDDPSRIQAGSYADSTMDLQNGQPIPMVIIVESNSDSLIIEDSVLAAKQGEMVSTEFRIWAPETTGSYVRARSVAYYPHVLPASVISFLHQIHPVVALFVTTGVILSPIAIGFSVVVGFRPISIRDTTR